MVDRMVGRSEELASVEDFLDRILQGPAALIVEGDTGSGKTTLWRAAIDAAQTRGYRVLACHPVESEASLAFAALGDLFERLAEEPQPTLPLPQYRALRVATLRADAEGPPPDQRAVSVAVLGVLRSSAARSPTLVAVDDLHWMDRASARVLEFALRRLETERIGVIAALRPAEPVTKDVALERIFPEARLSRLTLGPFDVDSLDSLLRVRLGESFPRPVLTQIEVASGGNPLFALEIARGILRDEVRAAPGQRLPVPDTLQELVRERLEGLPREARSLLAAAAAASDPTMDLLSHMGPRPAAIQRTVEEAIRAGVVSMDGRRLRFTHPLFASTLYHGVPPHDRRAVHRRLADAVPTPEERARHLALATDGPDAEVGHALAAAARQAAARGAPDAAAELCEQAYRLTPAGMTGEADGRRIEAAEYHLAAGDTARARRILEEMVSIVDPGPFRASILRRLAKVRYRNDSCSVAAELLTRALREAGHDTSLRAGIERDLGWAVALCGDVPDAAEHARSALRLAEEAGDDEMMPELLAATGMGRFLLGGGIPVDLMRRAVGLERPSPEVPIEWRPSMMLAMMLKWSGDLRAARSRFDALHQHALEAGEETSRPFLLFQMSEAATWQGDWATGSRQAEEAHTIALQTGQEPVRAAILYAKSLVNAHLGRVDEAREDAREGLVLSERVGSVVWMMLNQSVLGFLDLSLDDPAAAHRQLAPLVNWLDVVGIREPGVLRFLPDEIEALVALGELEKAHTLLVPYEQAARRLGRSWAILAAARCRALFTAAGGDSGRAADGLERALADHEAMAQPFDRARALLALGNIERRTRRKRAARESLEGALSIFEHLGATLWSEKVRLTLGGPSDVPPSEPARMLTPAERRVAELVASGGTNREVADRLFVSVRAVEVHLTSIYRKLGIRSRTQLALRMTNDDGAGTRA